MPSNSSATGGFLVPSIAPAPAPLEGKPLLDFIQAWIVGLTGLPGKLVRPEWQQEPGNLPRPHTAWCSFRISDRDADTFPWVGHNAKFLGAAWQPPANGADLLQRNESLWVHSIFYDTGVYGLADQYAALLRDGAVIAQNLEYLRAGGFTVGRTGRIVAVPELVKERWLYRVDLTLELRRQIYRAYPVLDIAAIPVVIRAAGVAPQPSGPTGVITGDSGAAITGDTVAPINQAGSLDPETVLTESFLVGTPVLVPGDPITNQTGVDITNDGTAAIINDR